MAENDLLERFIASFEKLDDMTGWRGIDQVAWELRSGEPDESGQFDWRPAKTAADSALLDLLYARIPMRLPPLCERLVLSYRWDQVDLELFRLLPNPPGPDLSGLLAGITGDEALWEALLPAGYIQFGRGPDVDHDPVCFDTKARTKTKDHGIVKIDHEEIYCKDRIKVVATLALSFEQLVLETIERAEKKGRAV
jgi:hypothetical protein